MYIIRKCFSASLLCYVVTRKCCQESVTVNNELLVFFYIDLSYASHVFLLSILRNYAIIIDYFF
jgi:hypothetical protein